MFRGLVKQILGKGENETSTRQDTSQTMTSHMERIIGLRLLKIDALQRHYRRTYKGGLASARHSSASPSVGPKEQEGEAGRHITQLSTQQRILIGADDISEHCGMQTNIMD